MWDKVGTQFLEDKPLLEVFDHVLQRMTVVVPQQSYEKIFLRLSLQESGEILRSKVWGKYSGVTD